MRKLLEFSLGTLTGAAGVLGVKSYMQYQQDLNNAQQSLENSRQLIQTSAGQIAYRAQGAGPPVLVIHGAGGGFDQSLHVAQMFGEGFEWIAPCRFGYLGSDLPANPSPAAQADAYAALLDALEIKSCPIVGMSAGGPSALQFALRHPARCTGLVMLAAISHAMVDVIANPESLEQLLDLALSSDWPVWVGLQLALRRIRPPLGVPMKVIRQLDAVDDAWLDTLLCYVLPVQPRRAGLLNDLRTVVRLDIFPLEQINTPTLVIHAQDDSLVSIKQGRFSAKYIPHARLVELPSGGHLMLGQRERVKTEIEPFLREFTRDL